jgi:hypothetical protein
MSWQDVTKEIPSKSKEGFGAAPTLILLYLAFGEDLGYRMAKVFSQELTVSKGWSTKHLDYFKPLLKEPSLSILLNKMEDKGLIISRIEKNGREKRYYCLNPTMISNPETSELGREITRRILKVRGKAITETQEQGVIIEFLSELEKKGRTPYLRQWSSIKQFDFIAFLTFLKNLALELGNNEVAQILD